jgi:hypothetical protein
MIPEIGFPNRMKKACMVITTSSLGLFMDLISTKAPLEKVTYDVEF